MRVDLVCHVVDNFGDIAVTWRLARSLLRASRGALQIRLLVDDWAAFHALEPGLPRQGVRFELRSKEGTVTVLSSTALEQLADERQQPADVIVEAFGAPTPVVWLEHFLAAAERGEGSLRPKIILHLEYLTAELWSQDYHLLPSPVGRSGVERWFFVPGFHPKTGGLIFPSAVLPSRVRDPEGWIMSLFSYEHDFSNFWDELGNFLEERRQTARVYVLEGRSRSGARASWERYCQQEAQRAQRILVVYQGFMDHDAYSALLAGGDFHVVRGEASWVDALLSSRPFLWHAYLQEGGHQSVKVEAFLDVWKPWFASEGSEGDAVFEQVARSFRAFNERLVNDESEKPHERYRVFWEHKDLISRVLSAWVSWLRKNADLGGKMLEFLDQNRL